MTLMIQGWFRNTLSTSEIETIKTAQHEKEVTSLWGKIMDFFCGTVKEQAKEQLFRLCSPTTNEEEKLQAFNTLKTLAAPTSQDLFVITRDQKGAMCLSIQNTEANQPALLVTPPLIGVIKKNMVLTSQFDELSKNINRAIEDNKQQDKLKGYEAQFLADVGRGVYYRDGKEFYTADANATANEKAEARTRATKLATEFVKKQNNPHLFVALSQTSSGDLYTQQALTSGLDYKVPEGMTGSSITYHITSQENETFKIAICYTQSTPDDKIEDYFGNNDMTVERQPQAANKAPLHTVYVPKQTLELELVCTRSSLTVTSASITVAYAPQGMQQVEPDRHIPAAS